MTDHQCVDCIKDPPKTVRKIATFADGDPMRCTTHLRQFTTRQKQLKRGSHVERTYDISAKDAGELLVFQGGRCWICRKSTGASKLLAVDHDHADDWVRGRLCSTCNQFITRQLGEDPEAARRLVAYFRGDTPYRRMLATRWIRRHLPDSEIKDLRLELAQGISGDFDVIVARFTTRTGSETWTIHLDSLAKYATPKR